MLTIVRSRPESRDKRLNVAISHLEAAIVHINNEAQGCIPVEAGAGSRKIDDLRLIVRALSDVIDVLRSTGQLESGNETDGDRAYRAAPPEVTANFATQ